jgi:hypothetical protein
VLPTGTCPDVALCGLSLGGGIGPLSRKYGMTSDNILSADIILANNKIVTVNNNNYNDLYFALRGAGNGNYGIITSLTFQIHYAPKLIYYQFNYKFKYIKEIIDVWQHWIPFADNNIGSELESKNNKGNIIVKGIYIGKKKDAIKLLGPLFTVKFIDKIIEKRSYADIGRKFAGTGRYLPLFKIKNRYATQFLNKEALDIIEKFMAKGNGKSGVELDAMRGKIAEIPKDETAFVHRNPLFWLLMKAEWEGTLTNTNEQFSPELRWVTKFMDNLSPFLSEQAYQNMPDITINNYLERYYGSNLPRLKEIKGKYDPGNVFNYAQSIPPK